MAGLALEVVPTVSAQQMREIDDLVISYGLSLEQMMENAGRSMAQHVIETYHPESVSVLVGPGHNGGGGLVAARHLANRGVHVELCLARGDVAPVTARQLALDRRIGVVEVDAPSTSAMVIDALLGYSLSGEPRGRVADLIDWTRSQASPVVSLDVPSALDATSGHFTRCVRAHSTLTLALPKTGLVRAARVAGEIYLADISIPRRAYEALGLDVPDLFATSPIVHLTR